MVCPLMGCPSLEIDRFSSIYLGVSGRAKGIPARVAGFRLKQVGFIEFVICPMAESICNIFPQAVGVGVAMGGFSGNDSNG